MEDQIAYISDKLDAMLLKADLRMESDLKAQFLVRAREVLAEISHKNLSQEDTFAKVFAGVLGKALLSIRAQTYEELINTGLLDSYKPLSESDHLLKDFSEEELTTP